MPAPYPKILPETTKTEDLRRKLLESKYKYDLPDADRPVNSVTKFINSLIEPIDPETGLPNVDLSGISWVGPNAKIWADLGLEQIKKANPKNAAEAALEYIKLKYPEYTKLPSKFEVGDIGSLGAYDPETNVAKVGRLNEWHNIRDFINYWIHENTHAYQSTRQKRRPELTSAEGFNYHRDPATGKLTHVTPANPETGSYIPSQPPMNARVAFANELDDLRNAFFKSYEAQKTEQQARQAAETATEGYDKFVNLIKPKQKILDLEAPITQDVWDNLLENAMKERYAQEINRGAHSWPQGEMDIDSLTTIENLHSSYRKQIEDFLKHGHRYASEPWFRPGISDKDPYAGYLPMNQFFGTPFELSEDAIKRAGYTRVVGGRLDYKDKELISLEDILGIPTRKP